MRKKIGLYGGTFDPIHYGHLNLVLEMKEKVGFDEIWLIPAGINPFKQDQEVTRSEHRLKMAELAVDKFPEITILDIEVKRKGISYAIDTLHYLNDKYRDNDFSIIIGEDAAAGLPKWKDIEEIFDLVSIYVGRRSCLDQLKEEDFSKEIYKKLRDKEVQTRILDISSTDIRKRVSLGLNCYHLLPSKVIDYIYKNQLYL